MLPQMQVGEKNVMHMIRLIAKAVIRVSGMRETLLVCNMRIGLIIQPVHGARFVVAMTSPATKNRRQMGSPIRGGLEFGFGTLVTTHIYCEAIGYNPPIVIQSLKELSSSFVGVNSIIVLVCYFSIVNGRGLKYWLS